MSSIQAEIKALKRIADKHRFPTGKVYHTETEYNQGFGFCMVCLQLVKLSPAGNATPHYHRSNVRCGGTHLPAQTVGNTACEGCGLLVRVIGRGYQTFPHNRTHIDHNMRRTRRQCETNWRQVIPENIAYDDEVVAVDA